MSKQRVDCAVVIALREEFQGQKTFHGFEDFFEMEVQQETGPFQLFRFSDSTGEARIGVVSVMESMSPLSAYETFRNLLDLFDPSLFVNIGISGALSRDLRLGDIVIADEIDAYDFRAKGVPSEASAQDFAFTWGGRHSNPSQDVAESATADLAVADALRPVEDRVSWTHRQWYSG